MRICASVKVQRWRDTWRGTDPTQRALRKTTVYSHEIVLVSQLGGLGTDAMHIGWILLHESQDQRGVLPGCNAAPDARHRAPGAQAGNRNYVPRRPGRFAVAGPVARPAGGNGQAPSECPTGASIVLHTLQSGMQVSATQDLQ